jgi:ribonucleoside-diphosphate reductase beta chain
VGIFDTRELYKPFEYPDFEEIHTKLMSAFWHPHEISLDEDINDFKIKISNSEKELVTRILRNFVQSEIHVGCFWGDFVADWIKKPEIQNVARFISGNESVHTFAYDHLNATLGLEEYHLLKEDSALYERIENLINKRAKNKEGMLKQIALYSVFGEGVALFS